MTEKRDVRLLRTIPLLLIIALLCAAAGARTIYVDDDAPAPGDGASWTTAYRFLQDALIEAEAAEDPVEIRVAHGIYKPDRGRGRVLGDRNATFYLMSDVVVKGGYLGASVAHPNARNVRLYQSVLSGDLADDDVTGGGPFRLATECRRDNSFNVVTAVGVDTTAVLDGFTITGGFDSRCRVIPCHGASGYGGGLHSVNGSPLVTNCTFRGNTAATYGGGAYSLGGAPTFHNCAFVCNYARNNGGGMYSEDANIVLERCFFSANLVSLHGGGLASHAGGSAVVANCSFVGNKADFGGAISNRDSDVRIFSCTFAGNHAYGPDAIAVGSLEGRTAAVRAACSIFWNSGREIHVSRYATVCVRHCNIRGGRAAIAVEDPVNGLTWEGGNVDTDPMFADPGYWDPNGTPDNPNDDFWVDGDYHLKSRAGRWDPVSESWVRDRVTSPCIDAGDPNSPVGREPFPNGGIVNMGAYGGTAEASKSPSGRHARYGGGTGEPNDPYLIYTVEHLDAIDTVGIAESDRCFKLMADLDLAEYPADQFRSINSFRGVFDGNGHTISNFTYRVRDGHYAGLFGHVDGPNTVIKNLGLIDASVSSENGTWLGSLVGFLRQGTVVNCYVEGASASGNCLVGGLVGASWGIIADCYSIAAVWGRDEVGGFVGQNGGTIRTCFCGGTVVGNGYGTGGLAGRNSLPFHTGDVPGAITDCYSTTSVRGQSGVGGLVGYNGIGSIRRSYATGNVAGSENVGGLVGLNSMGDVLGSFWDIQTSGQDNSAGGLAKTTAEMSDANTFVAAGWDFVGNADGPSEIWAEAPSGGYPILWWQFPQKLELPVFSGGTGDPCDPYLIATTADWNSIGYHPRLMACHFKLVNDIDLAGMRCHPVGDSEYPYTGVFDGAGFEISNFTCVTTETWSVGLFRAVSGEEAKVQDLGLVDFTVDATAADCVGGLIGSFHKATLVNCYVKRGTVTGRGAVAGLVGRNGRWPRKEAWPPASGKITGCCADVSVTGRGLVGGLIGSNEGLESITNSYSTGDVAADNFVGGMIGYSSNHTVVRNCYSAAKVTGPWHAGGFTGDCGRYAPVSACFWDIERSGQTQSAAAEGKTTAEMQRASTFLDAGWDFIGETENGTDEVWWIDEGNDYPRLWWEAAEQ